MAQLPEDYRYSSYGFFTTAAADKLVTTTTILEMLSSKPDVARKKYRSFVESALDQGIESPLKKVYGGIILGSVDFIKDSLGKIEVERLEKEETSNRRSLRASLLPEEVVTTTCMHYGLLPEEIAGTGRNDVRKRCIYLLKKHTSASNQEIGELLGGMGAASVAKSYQRFAKDLVDDSLLKKELKELQRSMSHVKG
jgi:chromosomal replication initiation ATPase DnaA